MSFFFCFVFLFFVLFAFVLIFFCLFPFCFCLLFTLVFFLFLWLIPVRSISAPQNYLPMYQVYWRQVHNLYLRACLLIWMHMGSLLKHWDPQNFVTQLMTVIQPLSPLNDPTHYGSFSLPFLNKSFKWQIFMKSWEILGKNSILVSWLVSYLVSNLVS